MRRLVVRGVVGGSVWVRGGGCRCRVWERGLAVVCVGGDRGWRGLVGVSAWCVSGLVSGEGGGG